MGTSTTTAGDRANRPVRNPTRPADFVRILGAWSAVVLTTAFGLRIADALPRVALGVPRGVERAASVAQLERAIGRKMPVPAYYPDTIQWPPAESRVHMGGSAAIWSRQRGGGATALVVATAPAGLADIAPEVLPPSVELQREDMTLGHRPATASRVRDADGAVWQQVRWRAPGQIILIRYRGTLDELLKIAGSVND